MTSIPRNTTWGTAAATIEQLVESAIGAAVIEANNYTDEQLGTFPQQVTTLNQKVNALQTRVLPAGGSTGKVLGKVSGSNYAVAWVDGPPVSDSTTASMIADPVSATHQAVADIAATANAGLVQDSFYPGLFGIVEES